MTIKNQNPLNDIITLDFNRFMKKIIENEEQKSKVFIPREELNPIHKREETPQREYVRRYGERAINRIIIGKK